MGKSAERIKSWNERYGTLGDVICRSGKVRLSDRDVATGAVVLLADLKEGR